MARRGDPEALARLVSTRRWVLTGMAVMGVMALSALGFGVLLVSQLETTASALFAIVIAIEAASIVGLGALSPDERIFRLGLLAFALLGLAPYAWVLYYLASGRVQAAGFLWFASMFVLAWLVFSLLLRRDGIRTVLQLPARARV